MRRWGAVLLGLLLALASEAAFAQLTCTSVGAGPNLWSAAGTWTSAGNCNRVPLAGDLVIIANGTTVSQTRATTNRGSLTINGTGVLNSSNNLTVAGATSVSGTLNITAGTKTFTGAVTISGTWNNSGNIAVTFGNNLTNNGTFTSGTNTQTFSNATPTITGTAATTFSGPLSVTVGG